jgi:hypothetical protein
MKIQNTLLALIGVCLMSCSTTPTNSESWMANQKNACLPTAIAFREGLQKYDVWSEVVVYHWIDVKTKKPKGHAIVAYMYPKGKNQLWTYDFWGSYRVRAFKDNPLQIAKEAVRVRLEDRDVYFAEFIK